MGTSGIHIHLTDYSLHSRPFWQPFRSGLDTYIIRLQMEGRAQALLNGQMEEVLPGDLLLFKPGEVYELNIGGEESPLGSSGDYYVMATGSWLDEWWSRRHRPRRIRIADDGKARSVWQQLVLEKHRMDGGDDALLAALLQALCLLLDRAIDEAPTAASPAGLSALRMRNYVETHALEQLRLEDVARDAGLSVSRAVHLFKERFGCSVLQYAQQLRLAAALRLMASSLLTLEQVAEECGFGSYSYFHRVFRERYGFPPGDYRKRGMLE